MRWARRYVKSGIEGKAYKEAKKIKDSSAKARKNPLRNCLKVKNQKKGTRRVWSFEEVGRAAQQIVADQTSADHKRKRSATDRGDDTV